MLSTLLNSNAVEIGAITTTLRRQIKLPISIEVKIDDWMCFHSSLQDFKPENGWWTNRKAVAVILKLHPTMYGRVFTEEYGVDWYKSNNLQDETHAIHDGLALLITNEGSKGILVISGSPQVENYLFAVEVLTEFLARKGGEF